MIHINYQRTHLYNHHIKSKLYLITLTFKYFKINILPQKEQDFLYKIILSMMHLFLNNLYHLNIISINLI